MSVSAASGTEVPSLGVFALIRAAEAIVRIQLQVHGMLSDRDAFVVDAQSG